MDKRYQAMLQRRADLERERLALIGQYDDLMAAAGDELTDDERNRADKLQADIEALDAKIDGNEADIRREEAARRYRQQRDAADDEPRRVAITDVREGGADDPMWGFADAAEFGLAVVAASARSGAVVDERLTRHAAPTNYHRETGAVEGYLVPPQMRQEIWELVFMDGQEIIDLVNWEPTMSNEVQLLADETTPWGASGIKAYWRSEGEQMSPTRLDLEARSTRLHELYAFVLATYEILQDAPRLQNRMTVGAARAIRWKIAEAFMEGNGVGKPLGILSSAALVTVAEETSQANDTIVAANLAKMYARQINPRSAVWLVNSDVFPSLLTLSLDNNLLWTPPAGGFRDAPGGFLFGRPIITTEHAATLGDANDVLFVDFANGYHAIRRTNAPDFAQSIHLYFDYGVEAFRWIFRVGGQPFMSAPISPANGSNTKSHFVALGVRDT